MTLKILVASRRQEILQLARLAYGPLDYQVITSVDPALTHYLARKNLPDLILLDFALLEGDSIDLLQELREESEVKSTPVLVLNPQPPTTIPPDAILPWPESPEELRKLTSAYLLKENR